MVCDAHCFLVIERGNVVLTCQAHDLLSAAQPCPSWQGQRVHHQHWLPTTAICQICPGTSRPQLLWPRTLSLQHHARLDLQKCPSLVLIEPCQPVNRAKMWVCFAQISTLWLQRGVHGVWLDYSSKRQSQLHACLTTCRNAVVISACGFCPSDQC